MKSLFNLCLAYLSKNLTLIEHTEDLPQEVKEWLMQFLASHDLLSVESSEKLLTNQQFIRGLTSLNFYLSDQVTDDFLIAIGSRNKQLRQITIVHCNNVSDIGIRAVTEKQTLLTKIELRGLKRLSSYGIAQIESPKLSSVDLSDCPEICSSGVVRLVSHNPMIQRLFLNHCKAVDDIGLHAVGVHLANSLLALELDFLENLSDPSTAINYITKKCPNLVQLSLCRYFPTQPGFHLLHMECDISSIELRDLDLYGNYFSVLPRLPENIVSIRLSCSGNEDVQDLISRLRTLRNLNSIRLGINCREATESAVNGLNEFLGELLPEFGGKIASLQIQAYQIFDDTMKEIIDYCQIMTRFSMDVVHASAPLLYQLVAVDYERTQMFRSIKLCRLKLPYKFLSCIGWQCSLLEEIEMSHMECIDDRFLKLLAANCPKLKSANFNGCRWVTDKGLCALARGCPLREVRVRATSVSDKCVYVLAQFCPDLEWISHADYTGRPKFSETALQTLRDSCVQRVIC